MTGIELIAKEREEQIDKHGYTSEHDDSHDDAELLEAAGYIVERELRGLPTETDFPWDDESLSKIRGHSVVGRLVIAAALIAAEIDRLQRESTP